MGDRRSGLIFALTASLIWGTTFIVSQEGFQYANPYNLVFLRHAIASLTVLALAVPFRKKLVLKEPFLKISTWLIGGIYALGFVTQYVGQSLTSASEASLLSNLAPILVPIAAFIVLKEAVSKAQRLAIVLGLIGLLLVASPKFSTSLTGILGDLLLFATSVCYTLFIVLSKRYGKESAGNSFVFILIITMFLFPVAVCLGGFTVSSLFIGLTGWIYIFYLGIACSVIALTLYLKGLSNAAASETALLLLVQILTGLALAWVLLGEKLTLLQTLGAIIILSALILVARRTELGPAGLR